MATDSKLLAQSVYLLTPLEGECHDVGIIRDIGGAATLCRGCAEKVRPGILEFYRMKNPEKKPNCYECKHQGSVPGSAHSSCQHPNAQNSIKGNPLLEAMAIFAGAGRVKPFTVGMEKLTVTPNPRGIAMGWFLWPLDFDPVWLLTCSGFETKK